MTDIGENILVVILGDIMDKGNEFSFATAHDNLSLICEELKDYDVDFEFVSIYSNVLDKVNFIFADLTLSRDYYALGRLELDAIFANVKYGLV